MSQPQVVFGSGHVHITQVKDALGNTVTPPQIIAAPAVQNVSADFGKADVKMLHGQKEHAIHAAQGKKTTEVSFECGELYVKMLNALYFGQSVSSGSHTIYRDVHGTDIPESYRSSAVKIGNRRTFHLGKWLSTTSVTIGGSAATASTSTNLATLTYGGSYGNFRFSANDVGKSATINWTIPSSAGTTTVATSFKIPSTLAVNLNAFNGNVSAKLTASPYTGMFKKSFTNSYLSADSNEYAVSPSGVFILASSVGSFTDITITHTTSSVVMTSVVATVPAASYCFIVDPPSSTSFVSDLGVILTTNVGTAMTGVSAGEYMTKVGSGTPVSGEYKVDANGIYTFAAADNLDIVSIDYTTDFEFITVSPPSDGAFVADKGVRNTEGMPLTRVALTSPISLLRDQYSVSDSGSYYFDFTNRGDTVYLDYEYSTDSGVTLNIENNDIGSTPIVSIDISGVAEGQEWLIKYPRAVPKAFGFATKQDDFGTYKVTFEVIADRVSNRVGTVYMTG